MTKNLQKFLRKKGYKRIKLKRINTNHYELKARINGIKGRFILDTGASSSCVDFGAVKTFKLKAKDSKLKAAGAGDTNMDAQISKKNTVRIGKWAQKKVMLVLFNLEHINTVIVQHKSKPIDGIIGADILQQGKAVIDYEKSCLYLK